MITPEPIEEYCERHSSPPTSLQKELMVATKQKIPQVAHMQVGHLEGKFLTLLTSLMNAKHVLEFGTFTGYSALALAEGLPTDGKVTTLDRDPQATAIAREFWAKSKHAQQIELIIGDARETVKKLTTEIKNGARPLFDFAFIDADKAGYETYWNACFQLVRPGGAILVDNVLWSGAVLAPEDKSDHTMVAFNTLVANDSRVEQLMIPLRDGLTVAKIK
jgi:caffeoyl-CoA O-methyltransferase